MMMQAEHSINILAWELSLSFGLITTKDAANPPSICEPQAKWITLEVENSIEQFFLES